METNKNIIKECYLLQVLVTSIAYDPYSIDLLVCTDKELANHKLSELDTNLRGLMKQVGVRKVKDGKDVHDEPRYEINPREVYKFFLKTYNIDDFHLLDENNYSLDINLKTVQFLEK